MAFTSIKFMNAKDELVARGSHTKYFHLSVARGSEANIALRRYIAIAWKDENNITDELKLEKT